MRKIAIALLFAVSLSGCAQLSQVGSAINAATVGVQNPVTKQDLKNIEDGLIVAFAGLNAYRKVCESGTIDQNCKVVIRSIQVYTRKIPPLLTQARDFVKNNDQVNAKLAYNEILKAIASYKAIATTNNIQVN